MILEAIIMRLPLFTLVACLSANLGSARGAELITNGGFETGTFKGWSALAEPGSAGDVQVVANDGSPAPISALDTAINPTGGKFVALTDEFNPSAFALSQTFTLSHSQNIDVSFDLSATNWDNIVANGPLDFSNSTVQFARADILVGSADPFSTSPLDVVANLYAPGSDADQPAPYTHYNRVLSLSAGTYMIRFGEANNDYFFNLGVDNVSVVTMGTIPLPGSAQMLSGSLLALAGLAYGVKRGKAAAV